MATQLSNSSSLDDWLSWLEQLDPAKIKLGLERVQVVWQKANVEKIAPLVVTVAGTNGKGSCIGFLENILVQAGYKVGSYTSPHIHTYNERVRLNRETVDDQSLVNSFARIDSLRGETDLTYFEFGTLAALDIFAGHALDIVLLEVGLGGRLDAVNIIDADVALVTSIDIDHVDWLGHDRESIGYEKAGVFREGKPVVCADANPPASLLTHAKTLSVPLLVAGRDFGFDLPAKNEQSWSWWLEDADGEWKLADLPSPGLGGGVQLENVSGVLAVLRQLPVDMLTLESIYKGIETTRVAGRFERLSSDPEVIVDVAHNPQSARALARRLKEEPVSGRTLAVLGAMADKDLRGIVEPLVGHVKHWYLAPLDMPRAADVIALEDALVASRAAEISDYDSVQAALEAAKQVATAGDRIVVFGSFYTVAEAMPKPV